MNLETTAVSVSILFAFVGQNRAALIKTSHSFILVFVFYLYAVFMFWFFHRLTRTSPAHDLTMACVRNIVQVLLLAELLFPEVEV